MCLYFSAVLCLLSLKCIIFNFYYHSFSALVLAVALATLPLKKLVTFYMYLVSVALMLMAHHISSLYVEVESKVSNQSLDAVFDTREGFRRVLAHLGVQCIISTMVAYISDSKGWTRFIYSIFTLPIIARVIGLPVEHLTIVLNCCSIFAVILAFFFSVNNISFILDHCREALNQVTLLFRAVGVLPIFIRFWFAFFLHAQLLIFWLVLFCTQLYIYMATEDHPIIKEGWIILFLAGIGECCATPLSLFALCITISYASHLLLNGTKLFLQGWNAFLHEDNVVQGWTEGFTMMLIAIQTGLLELKPLQRAFLMSVLLFIVSSSLIQSMYEIADPILLTLGASHNMNYFKHFRVVLFCTFLWMFPLYMVYFISQYFDADFWLLVIISSCLLTSVQVAGSLVIYALFVYDSMRSEPWEILDDVVYYARAITRVLEFVVAVFVVCYGFKETIFGEWSWISSSILIIHCYFNVWKRLQNGWKSFLLRREAAQKIESLVEATEKQLAEHGDVCAICFQDMLSARITRCGHFFHSYCLRKWLYVKEACPMCHQPLNPPSEASADTNPPGPAPDNHENINDNTHPEMTEGSDNTLNPSGATAVNAVEDKSSDAHVEENP